MVQKIIVKPPAKYPPDEMVDWQEVCRRLCISRPVLRRLKKEGLPYIRINSRLHRFKWGDVQEFLEGMRVTADEAA